MLALGMRRERVQPAVAVLGKLEGETVARLEVGVAEKVYKSFTSLYAKLNDNLMAHIKDVPAVATSYPPSLRAKQLSPEMQEVLRSIDIAYELKPIKADDIASSSLTSADC
eukprot:3467507-Alexandrium_andersonii.AAC.1